LVTRWRHVVGHRVTKLGSYLRRTENPRSCRPSHQRPRMVTLTYGFESPSRGRGRAGGADLPGQPAHGRRPDHRRLRVVVIGDWVHHGSIITGFALGDRGTDQGLLPGSLQYGHLRDHGRGPRVQAHGLFGGTSSMATAPEVTTAPASTRAQRPAVTRSWPSASWSFSCCWRLSSSTRSFS